MKITLVLSIILFVISSTPTFSQYNYSPPNKYLKNPYAAGDVTDFNSNALRRAKNTPPTYRTVAQHGFVVLLDSTKIIGSISLYGRCYNDLYGVIIRPSEPVNGRKSEYILNKSSLLAFGLMDRSENATPEQFKWEELTSDEDRTSLIMGTYDGSVNQVVRPAVNPDTKEPIPNMTETVYVLKNNYPHTCEATKLAPGYVLTTSGERVEGYIQIDRLDSLVVEVRISKTFKMNVIRTQDNVAKIFGMAPEKTYTTYKPYQLLEYGIRDASRDARLNETPSAFKWGVRIPGSMSNLRSTKSIPGYVMLDDGSVLTGEIDIKAEDQRVMSVMVKTNDGKKTFAIEKVVSFGATGFPKDESVNVTEDAFSWVVKVPFGSKDPDPAMEESKPVNGYITTKDGRKIEGRLVLSREYGFINEVSINPAGEKKMEFQPHQLLTYGSSEAPRPTQPANSSVDMSGSNPFTMIKQARADEAAQRMAAPQSSASSGLDDKTMRPAPDNPWNYGDRNKINNLPMASNTAINETSEENFSWKMGSGSGGKNFEKSIPILGYVKLKSGEKIKGELKIKRMNTKEYKYSLDEFEVKNDDGKFTYTQQEVVAYGAGLGGEDESSEGKGGADKIKPGDIVQGFVVTANPKLIITGTVGGYKTEPKSGYVQLADGTVNIGLVSERKTFSGRVDVTIEDLKGTEMKYKGPLLSHGYFDVVPFSEYPSSVYSNYTSTEVSLMKGITVGAGTGKYTDFASGYLRLIDGSIVNGKFAAGIPGVTIRDDADSDEFAGNICSNDDDTTPEARPVPPINKFFNDQKERKRDYTVNSELLDEIYYFKIKTENGKKEFRYDLVKAYGANGVFISQLTKNGLVAYEDAKLNFHKGNITTKKGEKLEGWIAHIAGPKKKGDYYGVYFTTDQNNPVTVYLMNDLAQVNQKIVEMEAYDPISDDFLSAKEMSSTFESHENGTVVDQNGTKKNGNITLEIPPKLWYGTSLILTDNNGVQEIFDKDNPIEMVEFSKGDSTFKYIMYRGVFVQVLKESGPLYYFRNPFPSIEKNSGKFLNSLINSAIQKGQESLANSLSQGLAKQGDFQSAASVYDIVANADGGSAINLGIYLKEYLVYYKTIDRGYLVLRKDMGSYTNYAEFDDLANGAIDYLNMNRKEIKALGEVEDYETGEGLQPALDFLNKSFTSGSR